MVVLPDHHQGHALHRGKVEPFVERPGRRAAVADVDERDAPLAAQLEGQGDPGQHRNHVAQMGNLAEVPERRGRQSGRSARVRRSARSPWPCTGAGSGSDCAPMTSIEPRLRISGDRKSRWLPPFERVRRPYRFALLAQRPEQSADHFALAVQGDEPLFERPRQAQVAIDFEELAPGSAPPGLSGASRAGSEQLERHATSLRKL